MCAGEAHHPQRQEPDEPQVVCTREKVVDIFNAKEMVQWVPGPYLPTKYDGDFAILNASTLDTLFGRCDIIGDNHFRKANEFLQRSFCIQMFQKQGGQRKSMDIQRFVGVYVTTPPPVGHLRPRVLKAQKVIGGV